MTLQVSNLTVTLAGQHVLHDVSFSIEPAQRFGVVGASGSGKTMLALAIAGILPDSAVVEGSITLDGQELIGLSDRERARIRGDQIGVVFQEPKSALNPLLKLETQVVEALTVHYELTRQQRREAAHRLAERVGLRDADRLLGSYPHEVSGGQRQRVAIAAAIATQPKLLIADEPTTALDVTVQRQIVQLFQDLSSDDASSLLFITHDLAVLAQLATHTLVLDNGSIVEEGTIAQIVSSPQHPVTRALVNAARQSTIGGEHE